MSNVEMFTLCDFVSNHNGKLTIVDTFDVFHCDKFPWRAYFGIAVKMRIDDKDADKELKMLIKKSNDNSSLFEASTPLPKRRPRANEKLVLAGNIKGLIMTEPGEYHCIIDIDGKAIMDYPFFVELHNNENK